MINNKKNLRCGLIGEKLGHSFSPQIHSYLADYSYELFEMPENKVKSFLKGDSFDAVNVTIPYKKTVMPYLDQISDEAKRIGSVNTLTRLEGGGLRGDNTDYFGFAYLVRKSNIEIKNKKVLILGTGGASLTAKAVCEDMDAQKITFVSRNGDVNYENLYSICKDHQIIINCTPVGMYPKNSISPIKLEKFAMCEGVIDMIYNPALTQLLLDAKKLDIPYINGLPMLVAQAKRACELFVGERIDDGEIDKITDIIERSTKNIVLVGMPGCGKTTVGNILSELTGRPLLDTDQMIVEALGKDIPSVFSEHGEEYFREAEHDAVCRAGKLSGHIIATGGGVVTREKNYDPLAQNGIIFFINRNIQNLARSGRPLSQSGNLSLMFEKRHPMYMQFCDYEVTNDTESRKCAEKILQILGGKNK